MTQVVHVAGARPNFPKLAPVMRALGSRDVEQSLINTGQHYDDRLSRVFFEQLGLPAADVDLGVGSGPHGAQTAQVMLRLEPLLQEQAPDLLVVYGDVNSTVAAALTAAKLGIAVAHVEAGLRSHDRTMPEEINRVVTDRISDVLYATSPDALVHLGREGVAAEQVHLVGNPMIDTLLAHLPDCEPERVRAEVDLPATYAAATLHRPSNVDAADALPALVTALRAVADQVPLVIPVHPRGRVALTSAGLFDHPGVLALEPLGYLEFVSLVRGSALVVTDSGGIQEETTVLGVPCLTLRPNTERPVTITHGTNRLTTPERLPTDVAAALAAGRPSAWPVPPLWDGRAGERIAEHVVTLLA